MTLVTRLALLALVFSGAGCGRSDLFSAHGRRGAGGGGGGTRPDGGGTGGAADGGGPDLPPPCQAKIEICDNGQDDNCNSLSDCLDPGCLGDRACAKPGVEICNNGLDDDFDGRVDCADPDCASSPACRPVMGAEICNNGRDDNADGLVDCSDPQCTTFPACLAVRCQADVQFGTLAAHGAMVTRPISTAGAPNAYASCAPAGGHGRVGEFQIDQITDVQLDFTQASGSAHVVSLFRAGANQACDQNLVFCLSVGQAARATHTYAGLAAGVYRVIVESFQGTEGSTTVTLSTGSAVTKEICNNGIDDDQNGLFDCQDSACTSSPLCVGSECTPDANVGALVVGAPAKAVTVNTATSQNRYHPTCAGGSTGADRTVAFTLTETATVDVIFTQGGDHTFSFFKLPPAGLACDADEISCFYPGVSSGDFALESIPAGSYILVAKATGPTQTGLLSLRMSAFGNRKVEICNNMIDDDGDGLVDCADPDCFGVGTYTASSCTPDVTLGPFSWGTTQATTIDTTTGKNFYTTTCGRGDGKEKVLRFTLTQPMALGLDCTQTGSHVLQLTRQLNPLDSCSANVRDCADPEVLPFGCAFAIPNLQPGTYNLIVEAFRAGSEGQVQLTLTGLREAVREICDNGVDDDGDGAIDCADLKCVTDPACAKFACRADQSLGLVPLDGSLLTAFAPTSMSGDDQVTAMCTSGPGGQDAVINFQLPALADLTLQWTQLGNHALAIYADAGTLLACEASTNWACFATAGASTGSKVFPRLPMGRYHLVVDADHPGSEGGVILQLSALPSP